MNLDQHEESGLTRWAVSNMMGRGNMFLEALGPKSAPITLVAKITL